VHYQPFFAIQPQELAGYEALLRWDHPTRGRIPPADFIPLAEECGLIVPIGNWVLATACAEAVSWDDPVIISVNLSPAQFVQPGIVTTVFDVLQRTGLPPARLELEITEGTLMDDAPNALRVLTALKALGVKIAMDDFGTGYSSLSYLRKFPFDKIKIDRSFISDVGDVAEAQTIVQAIIALGRSLRLDVTAEGVETRRQLAMLQGQGCTFAQGYLLGHPHPPDQIGQHQNTDRPVSTDSPQPELESS
jgi:EAL domain-containing protein (putative c-di-GMP-specific phosphodiesterase class I)